MIQGLGVSQQALFVVCRTNRLLAFLRKNVTRNNLKPSCFLSLWLSPTCRLLFSHVLTSFETLPPWILFSLYFWILLQQNFDRFFIQPQLFFSPFDMIFKDFFVPTDVCSHRIGLLSRFCCKVI